MKTACSLHFLYTVAIVMTAKESHTIFMDLHVQQIRQEMPATTSQIYLNTGTFGPLATSVVEAMHSRMQDEWKNGRLGSYGFQQITEIYEGARQASADLLHAEKSEITLTDNTGEGLNIVCHGLNWQAGDEVIITNHEHFSAFAPLYVLRDRAGIVLRTADLGSLRNRSAAESVSEQITARTRLIVLSHVLWTTGAVVDVRAVCQLAHERGIPVLVDGAQSAGNIAIDVKKLEVDFYAIPMQKWLCGPDGTGALYINASSLSLLSPTYAGYYSVQHGLDNPWSLHATAQRFELGGRQTASVLGQKVALEWLKTFVGYDWLFSRISQLNTYAYRALEEVQGLTILTPEAGANGILTFTVAGKDDKEVVTYLQQEYSIQIRNIPDIKALRVSTGFYNTEDEIDILTQALRRLVS